MVERSRLSPRRPSAVPVLEGGRTDPVPRRRTPRRRSERPTWGRTGRDGTVRTDEPCRTREGRSGTVLASDRTCVETKSSRLVKPLSSLKTLCVACCTPMLSWIGHGQDWRQKTGGDRRIAWGVKIDPLIFWWQHVVHILTLVVPRGIVLAHQIALCRSPHGEPFFEFFVSFMVLERRGEIFPPLSLSLAAAEEWKEQLKGRGKKSSHPIRPVTSIRHSF